MATPSAAENGNVFWWFERNGQYLRYEARQAPGGGFEMCVVEPDGTERVERFATSSDLARRQQEFEEQIAEAGWNGPHGWNL